MIYTLENENVRISVNTMGAELFSLYSKKTETEYLWQGDKTYWGDRALNLFPFIGRMYEGYFNFDGKKYPSRCHGLARFFEFTLEKQTENSLTFLFTDDENTHKEYPYAFEFRVTFTLNGYELITHYEVVNTDDRTMICAFGGHPGINIPFGKGNFEDYYLDFGEKQHPTHVLFAEGAPYLADKSVPYALEEDQKISLTHELFYNDAIVLENTKGYVAVRSKADDRYVSMRYDQFKYIGFWQAYTDSTPYVCLEPWSALPASYGKVVDLESKPNMVHVPAGEKAAMSFTLEIHE